MKASLRVGALLAAAAAAFLIFFVAINKNSLSKRSTYEVSGMFSDATGLADKTRVQIAGIDVGRVDRIELVGNMAKVVLRIRKDVPIYEDAQIAKVSESLLGDFKLDITPGSPDKPRIVDGGQIANVKSQSDLNAVQGEMRQIAVNVREITDSLKDVLAGEQGEASLKAILSRIESATEAIDDIAQAMNHTVAANNANINGILQNVADLSGKLNRIADSVGSIIGNNEGDMKQSVSSLKSSMDKLNDTLGHLQSTARKIDEGQGTIGKLINDSTLHDNISEAAEGANQLIKRINGFETEVELRTEYHVPIKPDDVLIDPSGYLKNYVTLKLKPKPDQYYMFELVSDPLGSQSRTVTTSTKSTVNGATQPTRINDSSTIDVNALKFSLEFAKRFYFVTFRFGIIENTGGAGFNLHALNDRLELRGDVYDFGDRDRFGNALNPHLRSYALYEPIKHFYIHAGADDVLNYHYLSITGGAGIRFNDEDLKALLGLIATGASGAK